jgi:hypothetical protein
MIMSRKKKFKRVLLCALLISLPLIQTLSGRTNDNVNDNQKVEMCITTDTMNENTAVLGQSIVSPKDSIKNELIDEVENYIFNNYPRTHKDVPTLIVENGLENDIDILFMMAQTQQETGYGNYGAGRESSRRSLFGVAVRRYNNYETAIVDYIKILKKSYLTKGRTEQHLMQRYVTTGGARYAGDRNYEATLRKTYQKISQQTRIKELQKIYKNMET